jgi:hypothetical protein
MTTCLKCCQVLIAINISNCIQLNEYHISTLVETIITIPCLEKLAAEATCLFTVEIVNEMFQTKKLKELAVTPALGPPPLWVELMGQNNYVKFGEYLMTQWERINLPN